VVLRSGRCSGSRISFRNVYTLPPKTITCRVKQLACDAATTVTGLDKETNDGSDRFRVLRRLVVEGMQEVARCRVTPTNGRPVNVREIALHQASLDSFTGSRTIL
jgi:hypothetical protein